MSLTAPASVQVGKGAAGHDARPAGFAAILGALGVVFGDIGTSPLYALRTTAQVVSDHGTIAASEVLGVESLLFWTLMLIVTVKYVILVMRADYNGEGGIIALMSLAQQTAKRRSVKLLLGMTGVIGACLFFGDGIISPAVSVISAIEGIEVSFPAASHLVVPLSIVVLIGLFSIQFHGTGRIGIIFGPVMVVWFLMIGILGVLAIIHHPGILLALSPIYAIMFIAQHGYLSFLALGSVVLAVTGAEALYADMSHFGRRPIREAWLFFVLPCLALNYFGQGALLISDPATISNPFFLLGPQWLQVPMIIISTIATVIASQACISGGFSLCRQLIQLGYVPRMRIIHTNPTEESQIYLPGLNHSLMVGALLLVIAFRSSEALASAYGIAVTGTFLCTCILAAVVYRDRYKWSPWATIAVFGGFFIIDGIFFASNTLKIIEGGWVPVLLAAVLILMMFTWKKGRSLVLARQQHDAVPVAAFMARLPHSRSIIRVPGTGVFMTANPEFIPTSLLHNLKHNKVLHEHVILLTVKNLDLPQVMTDQRAEVAEVAPNIYRVTLRYGFMEMPNLPPALAQLQFESTGFDVSQASYFVSRELLVRSRPSHISRWRMALFLLMTKNATPITDFLRIPLDRVVELGVRIGI